MPIRVTAVAFVGYEHDWMDKILRQWMDEGFVTEEQAEFRFALQLSESLRNLSTVRDTARVLNAKSLLA